MKLSHGIKFLMMTVVMVALVEQKAIAQNAGGKSGAETGHGVPRSAADLNGYCSSADGILVRAKGIALEEFADGDLPGARDTLVKGMVKALKSFGGGSDDAPLTQIAMTRGIQLNGAFQSGCTAGDQPCLDLELRTALFFLGKYYDYVLNVVAPLDEQYYIPYVTRYHHCHDYSCLPRDFGNDFFVAYKDSAIALLDFYNGEDPRSGLPDTLAKDVYELSVAENVLGWAASDLNNDLWRRSFACSIEELSDASQDIAAFNAGDASRFKTSRRAVLFARSESVSAARQLSSRGCVIYPVWH